VAAGRVRRKVLRVDGTVLDKSSPWWAWEVYTLQLFFQDEISTWTESQSQRQLSIKSGVSEVTISNIKHRAWHEPRYSTILKLAKAFGYEVKVV